MKPAILKLVASIVFCAGAVRAEVINVFAAASLSDVLLEIVPHYERTSGDKLRFNFGGSGMLARQITEGAPAHVFISADKLRVDQLVSARLVRKEDVRSILSNTLVVVVASDSALSLRSLEDLKSPDVRRIAIGQPETVPAGRYAKIHLEQAGLWDGLRQKTLSLENVRAVLAAVEATNADAGFVYRTDAIGSGRVKIAIEQGETGGPRVEYVAAVVDGAGTPEAAREFIEYVQGDEALAAFTRAGFLPLALDRGLAPPAASTSRSDGDSVGRTFSSLKNE